MNRILAKHPQKINEQNQLGQTPLHLSANWAWGINRLLEAKALLDIVDTQGQSPIHYAVIFNCISIIQTLLAAGSPLDKLDDVFRSFAPERELPLENFKAIVDALADRRRQLAELAKTVLSSSDYVMLVGSVIGLLDRTAYGVYKRIIESGHPVGPALRVSQQHTSVYHYQRYLTVEKANLLYNAGFYNVDAPDKEGYTPLMVAVIRYELSTGTSLFKWLVSKGADLVRQVTPAGTLQIHFLALGVGKWVSESIKKIHSNSLGLSQHSDGFPQELAEITPLVKLLFQEEYLKVNDDCFCECSVRGCSTLSILRKECLRGLPRGYCRECAHKSWRRYDQLNCDFLKQCLPRYRAAQFVFLDWVLNTIYGRQEIPEMIINDFIRWFLFLELGITHTCCTLYGWEPRCLTPLSPDEISEIQDEEKELIAELEALCQEASLRWCDHIGSFVDFLQPFLQEVHERPSRAFSRKDVRRMEEIGVVLQPGTVVECDSGSEPDEEVEQDSDEDVFEDAAAEVLGEAGS